MLILERLYACTNDREMGGFYMAFFLFFHAIVIWRQIRGRSTIEGRSIPG